MIRLRSLGALAAIALAGCSGPTRPPDAVANAVALSTTNPDANVEAVVALFRRVCLEAGSDSSAIAAALRGSGWNHEQVQAASGAIPIATWRLDHGELVHSAVALGPGTSFVDCQLSLDAEVAPSVARLRDALRPAVSHPSLRQIGGGPNELKWQWRPTPREERALTIGPAAARPGGTATSARPRLAIHLGVTQADPPPGPSAIENVQ